MSNVVYLALGVDTTMLSRISNVRRATFGVPQSPGQCTLPFPTVILVMLGSLISGLQLTTTLPYGTSQYQDVEISSLLIKIMVLVPSTRPDIPCASRTSQFSYYLPHILWYLGLFIRCQISISSPFLFIKNCVENFCWGFLLVRFYEVNFSCAVSTHTNIASWVNDRIRVLIMVLYSCTCRVSMLLLLVPSNYLNANIFIFGYAAAKNLGYS